MFHVLVFEKRQGKVSTKNTKSLEEVVKELKGSRSELLLIRCFENSTKFPEKCPCKS